MTELLEQAISQVKQLPESEQNSIAELIIKALEHKNGDFWTDFEETIADSQVSTGIADLSYQHDHYVHGVPKLAKS